MSDRGQKIKLHGHWFEVQSDLLKVGGHWFNVPQKFYKLKQWFDCSTETKFTPYKLYATYDDDSLTMLFEYETLEELISAFPRIGSSLGNSKSYSILIDYEE